MTSPIEPTQPAAAAASRPTLNPPLRQLLSAWLPRQRWFMGKGSTPVLRRVGGYRFSDPAGEVGVDVHLLADTGGERPVVYHVPLTFRAAPLEGAEAGLVGEAEHSELGHRWIYDGAHDPVFAAALLKTITTGGTQDPTEAVESVVDLEADEAISPADAGDDGESAGEAAAERAVPGQRPGQRPGQGGQAPTVDTSIDRELDYVSSRVLTGEQSNTSIIFEVAQDGAAHEPIIIKIFRTLQDGANPDVTVQTALTRAGSHLVPAALGSLASVWDDVNRAQAPSQRGHVAFAQQFFPDVEDAWREALWAAQHATDFSQAAHELGVVTATLHQELAEAFPTPAATPEQHTQLAQAMRARLQDALAADPGLIGYRAAAAELLSAAETVDWPALQRIHGDYHLGQVLHVPGRGWVALDFEGEPLRPLGERVRPDLKLRDVAGMLRSFDYAGGAASKDADSADHETWTRDARTAFLDGYQSVAGDFTPEEAVLLRVLELDKALYEVVYEARNRPTWLSIPHDGVLRLLERAPAAAEPPAPAATLAQEAPMPDLDHGAVDAFLSGRIGQPHDLLGHHLGPGGLTITTYRPMAQTVEAKLGDGSVLPLIHVRDGFWSGTLPGAESTQDYRLLVSYGDGVTHEQDDPYRFAPTLGELDRHLINEGRHEQLWTVLGSHLRHYDGPLGRVEGASFAVWAPNARAIHVIGDFNGWDRVSHPMRALGTSGVWELFIPGAGEGSNYQYAIRGADEIVRTKSDPMARRTEIPPKVASVVTESTYDWHDTEWLEAREGGDPHTGPMSIFEVHLGSWRQGLSYIELAEHLVNYVKDLGFTHVELLPVMEHPYGPSWGYQVTGYYAPTARFGTPDEFRYLVDKLHQAGIGVILDWVPGHFPKDEFALGRFDGTPLYEHPDPRRGDQPDWGTYVFNFGRAEVRNFIVANAIYWLEEFHIDGLRVDAVASMLYLDFSRKDGEWLPNIYGGREHLEAVQLLQEANATAYKRVPGIVTIAEESTSWPGITQPTSEDGLGFGYKWNMGWMNDTLRYLAEAPINRQHHHNLLTFSLVYAFSENFVLPISHDEVVHGKGSLLRKSSGTREEQLATLRAFLGYMWAHPGKQLLFMGCEFAQEAEWADGRSLDWWLLDQPAHYRVHAQVKDMNAIYKSHPALWELDRSSEGFQWINADDAGGNVFSWLRYAAGGHESAPVLAAVVNFSGNTHESYRIGVPRAGGWKVIMDTAGYRPDAPSSAGVVHQAQDQPWDNQPYSIDVTIAGLSTVWLVPDEPAVAPEAAIKGELVTAEGTDTAATDTADATDAEPTDAEPTDAEPIDAEPTDNAETTEATDE